jgi:hypothetical protein
MIPLLSHIENSDQIPIWVTTDNVKGWSTEIESIDLETNQLGLIWPSLKNWIQVLDSRLTVKFEKKSYVSFDRINNIRSPLFEKRGYTRCQLIIHVQGPSEPLAITEFKTKLLKLKRRHTNIDTLLLDAYSQFLECGIKFRNLPDIEISKNFPENPKSWVVCESYVDTGTNYKAVIRLNKPSHQEVESTLLTTLSENFNCSNSITLSAQKLSSAESELILRKKAKQAESEDDSFSEIKKTASESALKKSLSEGDPLFRCEMLITLENMNLLKLREDLIKVKSQLSQFGEFQVETFGALPSLAASYAGSEQHVGFLEFASHLLYYAPIFEFGNSNAALDQLKFKLLSYRKNKSIAKIDLFDPKHLNANAVVIGSSGRGKSALVGTLTMSLLQNPNVSVVKVDVGGSHSRECELNHGIEYRLSLENESGLNPFEVIQRSEVTETERSILVNFISVLILEENESQLSKQLKQQIDQALTDYITLNPKNPTLTDYFLKSKNHPRRELLSRWAESGIYGRAFSVSSAQNSNRLRYFNFSEIFQAGDPDFAQAGMAAVLAQFNLEMKRFPEKRLVLICDETPFFINKCFDFFKFSTANVRKFGASVVLVVQNSNHLIQRQDSAIIDNSFHRFLFSTDGKTDSFQQRFNLSENQLSSIQTLETVPQKYADFFYQYGEAGFQSRLILSPEEYWQITTSHSEKLKIETLLKHVPQLKLHEALKCLSL